MVERFFSVKQSDRNKSDSSIMLLSGPPSCGKTSLLFQFAFNCAAADGYVVLICNKRKLESKPPYLSQGIDASSETFRRIQMKYVDDDEGINNYFAAFHLHYTFPVSVIIDDFGGFFRERSCQEKYGNSRGRDLAMVRTLALCRNAMDYTNVSNPCKLLLSDTQQGESPRLLFIYKRWVPSIFTIKADGSGSFIVQSNKSKASSAKYSIALQYLVLEEINPSKENQQ